MLKRRKNVQPLSIILLYDQASTVFTDDCNLLLKNIIEGKEYNEKKQKYPQRGKLMLNT